MLARHLRRVEGSHVDKRRLRRSVRAGFGSYARYWVDAFRAPVVSPATLEAGMSVQGLEHVEAAQAAGTGVILALPHLGGWEFGGRWLGRRQPVTAVVEPLEPPELFTWFVELRQALGLTVVPLGAGAGAAVLQALHRNEVVVLLCDRDLTGDGVEVDFFGERTTLPAGPATLALRTGAALLPAAVYFTPRGGHHGVIRPPLPATREGRFRDDVARLTQTLAHELEALIRRAPDQWHLFQPNWPSDRNLGR
jgi:KDO2-lipid IV(A) lauroyltransferase